MSEIEVLILDDELEDPNHNAACAKVKRYALETAKAGKIREARDLSEFKRKIIESKSEGVRALILAFIDFSGPGYIEMAIPALNILQEQVEEGRLMTVLMSNLRWPNEDKDAEKVFGEWIDHGGQSYVAKASITDGKLGSLYLANIFATARKMSMLWADNERLRESECRTQKKEKAESPMLGQSKAIQAVKGLITQIAESDLSVLIIGETGTGKELVARAIHYASKRPGKFIPINCGSFSETLLESELFGYAKGSFTGAASDQIGLFEAADKGTIFLDEINSISPAMQSTLLRVLQDHRIRPLGARQEKQIDVRVIAATNGDLKRSIAEGRFREDLFFRLSGIPVTTPPLRERIEDLPELSAHFLEEKPAKGKRISTQALDVLTKYRWPGNIRELKNVIYRMAVLANNEVMDVQDVPEDIRRPNLRTDAEAGVDWKDLREQLAFRHPKQKSGLVDRRMQGKINLTEEEHKRAAAEGKSLDVFRKDVYKDLLVRVIKETSGDISTIKRILWVKSERTIKDTLSEFGIEVNQKGERFVL